MHSCYKNTTRRFLYLHLPTNNNIKMCPKKLHNLIFPLGHVCVCQYDDFKNKYTISLTVFELLNVLSKIINIDLFMKRVDKFLHSVYYEKKV
jgi:hypothetical protein